MEFLKVVKNRRSVRKYKNIKIQKNIIEDILEAGRWAPSAHNLQPWKFVVVEDANKIDKVVNFMERKADNLLSGFNVVMRDTAKNIKSSKLLLFIYNTEIVTKKFDRLGSPYSDICKLFEAQSVANAIENMLLSAHDHGLGAAWCGVALFCEKEINDFLMQNGRLSAVLSIGYPDGDAPASSRKTISEIAEFAI